MAALAESAASLRIAGDDLNPDEITSLLGASPDFSQRKGETIISAGARTRVAKSGLWLRRVTNRERADIDAQVAELLSALTNDLTTWRLISTRHRVDLFCGLFMKESNEGHELAPETLSALSDRGIRLSFDIYDPAGD